MDNATSYDERAAIRKAIRKLKTSGRKSVGSANYRRAGYQAPTTVAIPNSVTGNILPNKVNTANISKIEVPQSKSTLSYLKSPSSGRRESFDGSGVRTRSVTSPQGSVGSHMSDQSGKNVSFKISASMIRI